MNIAQFLQDVIAEAVPWYDTGFEMRELFEMFRAEGFTVEFYNSALQGDGYYYKYQRLRFKEKRPALLAYGARGARWLIHK